MTSLTTCSTSKYEPATDTLSGTAAITARATQNLSSFNLDFEGLTVRSVTVNGRAVPAARERQASFTAPGMPSRTS